MSVWDAAVNIDGPFLVGIASLTITGYILCHIHETKQIVYIVQ